MFAVFGMTREHAKRQAMANVKMVKNGKALTQAQYQAKFDAYVESLMDSSKTAKISPEFSTPEIAKHWMELAKKDGAQWLELCIHHPHKLVMRKGESVVYYKWSFYKPDRDYSLRGIDMNQRTGTGCKTGKLSDEQLKWFFSVMHKIPLKEAAKHLPASTAQLCRIRSGQHWRGIHEQAR